MPGRPLESILNATPLAAAVLIFATSSFDIFLVVDAGATFRIGQFFVVILTAVAIVRAIGRSDIPTLGLVPLLAWLAVQIAFIPATAFWPKSVGYCLWLLLDIALLFSFVQVFSRDRRKLYILLRWYLYSFGLVAAFGLIQFTLPLFGLPAPLVTQWWIQDRIPRLNGFSYEPSYYAAYLLIGFVLAGSLRHSEFLLLSCRRMRALRLLIGLSIVLSSSRLGISFVLFDVACRSISRYWPFLRNPAKLLCDPIRPWRIVRATFLPSLVAGVLFTAAVAVKQHVATATVLLAGTGLYGETAHSVVERANSFFDTLTVFKQHPFVGRSLGGVSSGIAELHGERIHSFRDSKPYEGMVIFAEVLAASGILGLLPFIVFVVVTVYKPLLLARSSVLEDSILLRALTHSLIFEWLILQFNQNILRPYLWVHLAVLATVYAAARRSLAGKYRLTPLPESRD